MFSQSKKGACGTVMVQLACTLCFINNRELCPAGKLTVNTENVC